MEKYNRSEPTIIKFSESGAKFMQLNMIAHDYAHDFNPGAQIGKERIKKAFSHVLQISDYLNKPQIGGVQLKIKNNKIDALKKTSKRVVRNQQKTKKNKLINVKISKELISKLLLNNKKIYDDFLQLNKFNNKINMLTSMKESTFIDFFYDSTVEEAIYVYVFHLIGFINYKPRHVKHGKYINYIYKAFANNFKFINNTNENKYENIKYLLIDNVINNVFLHYFKVIESENRHACIINILNDHILIQKMKIAFIMLSNMTENAITKLEFTKLTNYIDYIHNILFIPIVSMAVSFSYSSSKMKGGNKQITTYEECINAENKINELKVNIKEKIYTYEKRTNSSSNYMIEELNTLFTLNESHTKYLIKIYDHIDPSSRSSEQKRDALVDSLFNCISSIYSLNCSKIIREKKEEDKKEKDLRAEAEREEQGDLSPNMTNVGWAIVGTIAKYMLIRNNICDNEGTYKQKFINSVKSTPITLEDEFLLLEIEILQQIGWKGNPQPKISKHKTNGISQLDDNLYEGTRKILNENVHANSHIVISPLKRENTSSLFVINNAVTEWNNVITPVKSKVFCPLSSILDAMSTCPPSAINNYPETMETGITHFKIIDDNDFPYFDGTMSYINKKTASISVNINNTGYDTISYNIDNLDIETSKELAAAYVFKNQAKYIINCFSQMHESILSNKTPSSNTLIWDLFLNWGESNKKFTFVNELIKIGNLKSLGDVFQEINGICKNGAYVKSSYSHGSDVNPHFKNEDTPRVVLSNDRPSGVRIAFSLICASEGINSKSIGGYTGGETIIVRRTPIVEILEVEKNVKRKRQP